MDILKNREIINENHFYYRAVIENNKDPLELGRCQVRIMGVHPDRTTVPTSDLPWAEQMVPLSNRGINSGKGTSVVPLQGTWVWIFFDAGDFNKPVIVGSMYGVPLTSNPNFGDPSLKYPLSSELGKTDFNKHARGQAIIKKTSSRDSGIANVTGSTWAEPKEGTSASKYPYNTVIETESGHLIEYDDTPGNARIHIFHKSGTYIEIHDDGSVSTKVVSDNNKIVNDNENNLIKGSNNNTIRQNQENKIDGNQDNFVGGTLKETVNGKVTEKYNSGQDINAGPQIKMVAGMIYLN